jgi:hypothetical protein
MRTMTTLLEVRNLNITKHRSFKYAITNLYIFDQKND